MPPIERPEASAYGSAVSPTGYINGENALATSSPLRQSNLTRMPQVADQFTYLLFGKGIEQPIGHR
jgi:hypothetical protein